MHGNISTFGKSALKLIKDRNFQIGLFASTPVVVGAVISVEQYKKQLKEKQKAIEKVLRKHNAVIKELNDEIKISAQRQEELLAYDEQLKKEMTGLQLEIDDLKQQIKELENNNSNEQV